MKFGYLYAILFVYPPRHFDGEVQGRNLRVAALAFLAPNPQSRFHLENVCVCRWVQLLLWRSQEHSYKWVNPDHLCRLILPKNTINCIKYFTAHVTPRPTDPNQHIRQQTYLRALATVPHVEIILGHFLSHTRRMPLAKPPKFGSSYAEVLYTEEKGSDVNLATHLLIDGFRGRYQVAVVVTNDSDLAEPIRLVRQELGRDVIILNPHPKPSAILKRLATFVRPIRKGPLQASQFPHTMSDSKGIFSKPKGW